MSRRFRLRRHRLLLCAGAAALVLSACADFTITVSTPAPSSSTLALPPIGFNHRYGNNPLASKDGFTIEREFFAQRIFWEVALRTDPVTAGFVNLGDKTAVTRARHAVKSVLMVLATEVRYVIEGLIAYPTDAGQEAYCESVLSLVRNAGYDSFTSAQVLVFFTEADEHAKLSWSRAGGYTYTVFDHDLKGTNLVAPGVTPLPAASGAVPLPSPSPTP